ncbi:hypothetical protein LJ707_11840 [Mucilaginibacter sp. UR6-1]|uniref:hypothetical protein n=1 Tax=Mucilaginibacter sp. UR6-1 TaxID=1435643 RepID=UPI001E2B4E83|nr:hypothetical protein [Mucilaginibacter sp. UR6-1]MCC8409622.1 hypothetical protein [Mucilaginibacter sp. UR6-1]
MKSAYFSITCAVLLSACQNSKPENNFKTVTVEAISFQTETMFKISCEKFDTYYADKWRSKTITDKASLDKLNGLLQSLRKTDNAYEPDVRVKLLLTNTSGTADTVCLDDKITRYKNASYKTSVELANFVQQ